MTKTKSRFRYIGIDPGAGGGIAVIDEKGKMKAYKCPKSSDEMALLFQICMGKTSADNIRLLMERVWARPTNAVRAAFSYGTNYGQWQGILASHELEIRYATPKEWQSHFNIKKGLPKQIRKKKLKDMAIKGNPKTKGITLSTADALLIAMYGKEAILSVR